LKRTRGHKEAAYVSYSELAKILGVLPTRIQQAVESGRIRTKKVPVYTRKIPKEEAERVIRLVEAGKWDWGKPGRPPKV